jgi:hypothetical protein
MPEANSAPTHLNPPSRYPRLASQPAQNPKLLNRLREALRSRHYSPRPELRHGLFHLTHVDLFKTETSSPLAGEGFGRELSRTVVVRWVRLFGGIHYSAVGKTSGS